ncbi:hypothetical protein SKUN_00148 [Spiroplasma kunkelii CR2-3x]|uniref:Spiroplasmavirus-related protein n=1 Tax=Spiroplasma kunkelii CR2-3x TaxID=273035 RepID=A0A0K2JF73_SPIKU|nr:DUF3688 family protein [Spiroplasma kunkelii]ALA97072.1 hypothetical protein SKUN_00148 [Spiroplasma kunkelii CR2-3x]
MLGELKDDGGIVLIKRWEDDSKQQEFFKSLYKWEDNTSIPSLPKIDDNVNLIFSIKNRGYKNSIFFKLKYVVVLVLILNLPLSQYPENW